MPAFNTSKHGCQTFSRARLSLHINLLEEGKHVRIPFKGMLCIYLTWTEIVLSKFDLSRPWTAALKLVQKRSCFFQDGWNACNRYVKNNFCDGYRTDGLRFFVGDLTSDNVVSSIAEIRRQKESSESAIIAYLPLAFQLFVALLVLSLVCSRSVKS